MGRMNWEKANERERHKARVEKKRVEKAMHPNSMAARKWGRKTWRSS